jgi:LacI family transcriptional regulator
VREREQLRSLAGARIAGAVVVPSPTPLPETVRLLNAMPHVQLVRQLPVLEGPWMGIDDTEVLQRATAHLLALGHHRIAYFGGTAALPTAAARLRGFHAALAQAGLPETAGPVYLGPPESPEHGADAVRRILADQRPPTAVVTASVQITQGVLDELPAQGVRIPADLSIVGFGDEAGWSWWGPGLTTTQLPTERLASACALWLRNRLAETETSSDDRVARVLPTSLTVRGSTAPPPQAHRASLSRIEGGTDRDPKEKSS